MDEEDVIVEYKLNFKQLLPAVLSADNIRDCLHTCNHQQQHAAAEFPLGHHQIIAEVAAWQSLYEDASVTSSIQASVVEIASLNNYAETMMNDDDQQVPVYVNECTEWAFYDLYKSNIDKAPQVLIDHITNHFAVYLRFIVHIMYFSTWSIRSLSATENDRNYFEWDDCSFLIRVLMNQSFIDGIRSNYAQIPNGVRKLDTLLRAMLYYINKHHKGEISDLSKEMYEFHKPAGVIAMRRLIAAAAEINTTASSEITVSYGKWPTGIDWIATLFVGTRL